MPKINGNYSPICLELLITVVDKEKAAFYADLIQSYDVNLQLIVPARGTAKDELLEYLGLSNSERSAIFSIVRGDRVDDIFEALESRFRSIKNGNGVSVSVPFSSVIGKLVFGYLSNDRRMAAEEA